MKPPVNAEDLAPPIPATTTTTELPGATASVGDVPGPDSTPFALPGDLRNYPSRGTLARWLLVLVALYAVGWLLWRAWPAILPFVIGLVLAYLLSPVVNRLNAFMPRWLAILVVYLIGFGLIVGAITYIVPPVIDQVQQLIDSFPEIEQLQEMGRELLQQYQLSVPEAIREPVNQGVQSVLTALQENLGTYAQRVGTFLAEQVLQIINTVTFLIGFLIIPIWLFYILNDQQEGKSFLDRLLHPRIRPDFWNVWNIINNVLSDYIRGQLLLGLAVGAMVGAGLLFLRLLGFEIRYILLLSIIAGITELVPIIGPIIGAIPAIVLGFLSPTDPVGTGIAVIILYIIVQQLENNFLVPRIVGDSVGVHPAILTVVLIAMGQVFGLLGVILSAPLTAIARDLFLYTYERLGGQPPAVALACVRNVDEMPPRTDSAETQPSQA